MKKTFKNYEISVDETHDGTKRIMCQVATNQWEVSYHDFDELAETDEEAMEMFLEWLEEQEEMREEAKQLQAKFNEKMKKFESE